MCPGRIRQFWGKKWRLGFPVAAVLFSFFAFNFAPLAQVEENSAAEPVGALLLEKHCVRCHNSEDAESDLDLTTREGALAGGMHGPALVPETPQLSLMYEKIESGEMPEDDSLSDEFKQTLLEWILQGAPWPDRPLVASPASTEGQPHSRLHRPSQAPHYLSAISRQPSSRE